MTMTPQLQLICVFLPIILVSLYIGLYWTIRVLTYIVIQWQSGAAQVEWGVMKKIAAAYAFAFVFTLAAAVITWGGVVRLE